MLHDLYDLIRVLLDISCLIYILDVSNKLLILGSVLRITSN